MPFRPFRCWSPSPHEYPNGFVSNPMDASGEEIAFVMRAPKAGILHKLHFRTGTVAVSDELKISWQDVSGGAPDGVADQFRLIGGFAVNQLTSNTWYTTGIMTDDGTDTGVPRTVTLGERFAAVIAFNSFTLTANLNISSVAGELDSSNRTFVTSKIGGSYGANFGNTPVCALEYSDGTMAYYDELMPYSGGMGGLTFNSTSSPDEYAMRFMVTCPCTVDRVWAQVDGDGDYQVVIYQGTTALITSPTQAVAARSADGRVFQGGISLGGSVTLTPNVVYYASLKPTTSTSIGIRRPTVASALIWDQVANGREWYSASRTDAGAWTDDTLSRIILGLGISHIHDGASPSIQVRVL